MEKYTTAGHVIRNYRQQAKNAGYNVDGYTDEEILKFLGDDLRNQGRTSEEISNTYGSDFSSRYLDIINAPERGREGVLGGVKEFGAGFKKSGQSLLGSASAIGGMAAGVAGLDFAEDYLMEQSAKFRAEAAKGGPSIERATDVRWDNPSEVARFLAGGLGEATPSVLEAAGSYALGGGGGYLIAKQAAKKRLKEVVRKTNPNKLEEVFRGAIKFEEAGRRGQQIGSNIALGSSSFGMNVGEIYSELHDYTKLDPRDPNYIPEEQAKSLSVSFGTMAGGLDFVSAGALLNKTLGIGAKPAETYLKRLVLNLPSGVFLEGGTEAAQEFISMAAEKYARGEMGEELTADEINRLIDAGVLGALGGAQFSAMGAIQRGKKSEDADLDTGDEIAGEPEETTQDIDERLSTLKDRLAVETSDFAVGDEVEQFLGVKGKISAIRGDGQVEVLPEGSDEPITISQDTLSPVLRPIDDLNRKLEEVKERADQGDKSAQMEEQKALEEIDKQTVVEQPPEEQNNKPATFTFSEDGYEVGGITQKEKADIEEVYKELKRQAEGGSFRKSNSNHEVILKAGGMSDATYKKFKNKKIRQYLYQSGVTNENGVWQGETKQDIEIEDSRRQKILNDRADIIKNRLKGATIGDTVAIGDEEAIIYGFTPDNKVLFEENGVGVEPKKLRIPRAKKKVQTAPKNNTPKAPTEEDLQQARDEVIAERKYEEPEREELNLNESQKAGASLYRKIQAINETADAPELGFAFIDVGKLEKLNIEKELEVLRNEAISNLHQGIDTELAPYLEGLGFDIIEEYGELRVNRNKSDNTPVINPVTLPRAEKLLKALSWAEKLQPSLDDINESMAADVDFEAETERLIQERASKIANDRAKEQQLQEQEKIDEEKSNEQLLEEINYTEEAPKKINLPKGEIPPRFVGEFDITEGMQDALENDGSLVGGNWEGLSDREKSSTKTTGKGKKKSEVKTPGNRVLVVVEKANNDHDDVQSGQVRVMAAKKAKMDGRDVLKVYDSLRVGAKGKSPGWRPLYGKGKSGKIDATPLEGYRLLGKITTQRDAVDYDASKLDALFDDIKELESHPAFQTSMQLSSSKKWYGLFKDSEKAQAYLEGEGKEKIDKYLKEIEPLLGSDYLTEDGRAIDPSLQNAPMFVSSKERLDYLVAQAGGNADAIDAYTQAFIAFANNDMEEVVRSFETKEKVYDKEFTFDGKKHRIYDILQRAAGAQGYEPLEWGPGTPHTTPFDLPIVKAALKAAQSIEVPTLQSGGEFIDLGRQDAQGELERQADEDTTESIGLQEAERDVGSVKDYLSASSEQELTGGTVQFHKLFTNPRDLTVTLAQIPDYLRDDIRSFAEIDLNNIEDAAQRLFISQDTPSAVKTAYENQLTTILKDLYRELASQELISRYYTRPQTTISDKAEETESELAGEKPKAKTKAIFEDTLLTPRLNNKNYNIRDNFLNNLEKIRDTLTAKTRPIKKNPVPEVRKKIRNRLEVDNVNRARDSDLGAVNYLHREFGLDLRDALYSADFTEEDVDSILEKIEYSEILQEPLNKGRKYPVNDEVLKDKTNGARVKNDGTPFEGGFMATSDAKALVGFIDDTLREIGEKVISKDDSAKWDIASNFLKEAWIPESYVVELEDTNVVEKEVEFDESTKESQRQKIIDEINRETKIIKRLRTGVENLRKTGKRNKYQKESFSDTPRKVYIAKGSRREETGDTRPSKRATEIEIDQKKIQELQTKIEKLADRLNSIKSVKAKPEVKMQDTVVEDGMLLSEFAQTLSEFVGFHDGMSFLDDPYYNALADQVSIAVRTQESVTTLDQRIRHVGMMSPATGQVEESAPLVFDEKSAQDADRIARGRRSIAVRKSGNPLTEMGMGKQLADNQLAISNFLDGGQIDAPFSAITGFERILEIIESGTSFREEKAIGYIVRKLKANKALKNTKIRFVPWEKYSRVASTNEYGYSAAQYMFGRDEIWVSDVFGDGSGTSMENLVTSIVHEAIHVPTKIFLDVGYAFSTNNTQAISELKDKSFGEEYGKMYSHIQDVLLPMLRKSGGADMIYGLSSPDEFLSEVGSDYRLRSFLRNYKLTNEERKALGIRPKSKIRTAWDWVVNLLAKLLGVSERASQEPEMLAYAEKTLNQVISRADGLGTMGNAINAVNVRGISTLDIFAGPKREIEPGQKVRENLLEFKWIDGTRRKHIYDRDAKLITKATARIINSNRLVKEAFDRGLIKEGDEVKLPMKDAINGFVVPEDAYLGDILEHPELFKAYPQLKKVRIRKSADGSPYAGAWNGTWDSSIPGWRVGKPKFSSGRSEPTIELSENARNVRSTLIHEIQHAVDEIEGFPRGSNSEIAEGIMANLLTFTADGETFTISDLRNKIIPAVAKTRDIVLAKMYSDDLRDPYLPERIYTYDKLQYFYLHSILSTMHDALLSIDPDSFAQIPKQKIKDAEGMVVGLGGYTPQDFIAGAQIVTEADHTYWLKDILYFWNYGEITSRAQERLLLDDIEATGDKFGEVVLGAKDDAELDDAKLSKLQDQVDDKFKPGAAWSMPPGWWLSQEIPNLINEQDEVFDVLSAIKQSADTFTGAFSASSTPSPANKESIPRPDDSARVYHEATAGGINELVTALTQAFKASVDKLPGADIGSFIDKYGKMALGFGTHSVSSAMKAVGKNLQPFEVDVKTVKITDAGRNRVAKLYGIRNAIAYIERTREHARNTISDLVTSLEANQIEVANHKKLLKALETRQLESLEGLSSAIRDKIVGQADSASNQSSKAFERLEKYLQYLPNSELTQADLKEMKGVTNKEIGDAMVAIINQPGILEESSLDEINGFIETAIVPGLAGFQGNDKQTALRRTALVYAIKNSGDIMSLLRLARNKLGVEQKEFLEAGYKILKAKSKKEVEAVANTFQDRLKTKIKHIKHAKMRVIELEESVKGIENEVNINKIIDETLKARSDKYRFTLGELEDFDIRDGSKIRVMRKNAKGEFDRKSFQVFEVKFQNGDLVNRKEFIKANRETLEWVRNHGSEYRNEPWFDIMREQAEMALTLPVTQQWTAARRSAWMAGLESLNQRFSRLGYEGKRLAQMTSRTVALYRDLISKSMRYSKEFNRAYQNATKAVGETGTSFYTGLYQDIFWWFDNHPEYAENETEAFTAMWKDIRKSGRVKDKTKLNDESRRAVKTLVEKTIQARDWEAKVNRDLGNRIRDDKVKVQSYLDGEKSVDFYRMPLDMGYATLPRAINDAKVNSLVEYMEEKGWAENINNMAGFEMITMLHRNGEIDEMVGEIEDYFDEQVVQRFVNPHMDSMNRKSLFFGPQDKDGWGQELSNTYVGEKWRRSDGNVIKFMDAIYADYASMSSDLNNPQARADWYLSMFKQLHKRYRELANVSNDIKSRAEAETRETEALKHVPRSLDARQVESRLPKEFFLYDMYDEVSTPIRMAMFSAASVFGRDGSKATEAFSGGRGELKKSYDLFRTVIAEATGEAPDKPSARYSKAVRKEAHRVLKDMGFDKPREKFDKIYNDSVAYGEMLTTFRHLKAYYGANNDAGPFKDARFLLELLGTQSLTVLNNPKSSFWQGMSLFEFPLAFRGANKMATKGTAKALANFANQTFGGVAEALGMQLDRVGRYASSLNNTHFRMEEMELPLRDYLTQVGRGGDLMDPSNMKRYLRIIKGISTHHKKRGTRAPVDLMSAVTGIFPYVNNVVNHSVGVGAAYAYQDLVLKVARHIKNNGLRDFQEISADDLGMGQSSFEWIVGEKDGYVNANNMLVDAGAPTISRMAFDYLDRLRSDPNAPVMSHEQILMVNQVAMNNMSGEGFNSKPAWLYTNPMMKYFAFFLGWPLGKMARDNKFIFRGDTDSVNSYAAFLKYLGLMSAIYLPVGLSFAFLIDWYDEEVLGKPNSLPPLTPWAMLPIVGPGIALSDEQSSFFGLTSRMAKAGTPYGMGFDVMNSMMAKGDTYGGVQEFSLDSRIFAFSIIKNIYDSMGNWMHQGEFDWGNVGRPLTYAFGGNSALQAFDATNNLFDLDNFESRVADYIGVRASVKKTAFLMGMNLRGPSQGFGRPSKLSVNVKQMERAAYAGDEEDFNRQYEEALEAAREYLEDNPQMRGTPESIVLKRFKDRGLRSGITRHKIPDAEWEALLELMPSDQRAKVKRYEANQQYFIQEMGLKEPEKKQTSMDELRRKALLGF